MVSVQELYELWAGESELDARLKQSLEPRGTEWLFELFASLVAAARGADMQAAVQAYLQQHYPGAWEMLEDKMETDGEGNVRVDFDRSVAL